eukprot:8070683-Alexandrium_andersonii.AAC.1
MGLEAGHEPAPQLRNAAGDGPGTQRQFGALHQLLGGRKPRRGPPVLAHLGGDQLPDSSFGG